MKAFTLVALFGLLGATSAAVVPQERRSEPISADSAMVKRCGYGGGRGRDIEPECIPEIPVVKKRCGYGGGRGRAINPECIPAIPE
ncbi:unnamed protein product [Rhizoctonia solani]|uniref:Kazal-like domain-containing protein n=1 Tax=Rhizoctonia solani TaxID=456999 RepID=A0A8H2X698_9AGAM|nr:unnamed protein product [Rhizoctonia solani]CAE6464836.1 unnamed protein product [Rhizoctonia solani]